MEAGHAQPTADRHSRRAGELPQGCLVQAPCAWSRMHASAATSRAGCDRGEASVPTRRKARVLERRIYNRRSDGREGDRRRLGRPGETRGVRAAKTLDGRIWPAQECRRNARTAARSSQGPRRENRGG